MRAVMHPHLPLTWPVIALYDFRQLSLLSYKYVLHVAQLAAPLDALLVLYGIKVSYVGPYG